MKKLSALVLIPFLLLGCGDSESESTTTTIKDSVVLESDQVSATGVLLAALVLRDGDIEQALADGRITVAEVDAAISAIQNETLPAWVALAGE